MDRKLTRNVPIHIVGDAIGVEKGGELQQFKRDVKISVLPGQMPRHFDVDVTELTIGSSIHVRDLKLGEGIEILDAGNITIVTVPAKRGGLGEEAAPAAAAEGEEEAPEGTGTGRQEGRKGRGIDPLPFTHCNRKTPFADKQMGPFLFTGSWNGVLE